MGFVRKIIDSDKLDNIVKLPENLKHKKIEILIFPASEEKEDKIRFVKEMRGAYKTKLSSSTEFSKRKIKEKEQEERKFRHE